MDASPASRPEASLGGYAEIRVSVNVPDPESAPRPNPGVSPIIARVASKMALGHFFRRLPLTPSTNRGSPQRAVTGREI
jgi:hypothetical protein